MKLVKSQRPEGIRRDRGRRRLGNEFLAESDPDGIAKYNNISLPANKIYSYLDEKRAINKIHFQMKNYLETFK